MSFSDALIKGALQAPLFLLPPLCGLHPAVSIGLACTLCPDLGRVSHCDCEGCIEGRRAEGEVGPGVDSLECS